MTSESFSQLFSKYVLPLFNAAQPFLVNLLVAFVIFFVGQWVAKIASNIVGDLMKQAKLNPALVSFGKHMTYFVLWIFVAIAALNKLGVETTSFVALVGAAGLAVGLALQGALSNFAAGVMILIFQPFGIGDTIDAGGALGVVQEIQMFNTIFLTAEDKTVIVPNSKITADKITVQKRA
ncbi:MAG: mechanosensitive ion channel [Candidatus Omnitrophica bacterium]|nr:mechanosensitive ion channel [Candidatus Omnitrophota bacterium]